MSEIIDLTGDDTVDTLPAPRCGHILLNSRQPEMNKRLLQQRSNRKKKRTAAARLMQL